MANLPLPKGFQRLGAFPLDSTTIFASLSELETYAAGGTSYAGQICAVVEGSTVTIYKISTNKTLTAIGERGPAGADGQIGATGSNGLSAYQVAVANGFSGDEVAWLFSLIGETGPAGYTPVKGVDYFDGAPGQTGPPGSNASVTKESVEAVLTGTITSHNHGSSGISDVPDDGKIYVRRFGAWEELSLT